MSAADSADGPGRPALRVVRGAPTDEELAALTALITAASAPPVPAPRVRRGGWNDPLLLHRPSLVPGPNAWRASSLPR